MPKVTMIGKITCAEGKGEALEAAFAAMTAASREEDGVEIYSYHRGEGGDYWFFALMSSMEAVQSHGRSEAMSSAMSGLKDLMAGPPQMSMATPLPANGFEV